MTKTYLGFLEFVKIQPPEKKITHAVWGKCAVGEYVNGKSSDDGPDNFKAWLFASKQLPTNVWKMLWTKRPQTYKDLVNNLKELGEIK